MNSLEFIDGSWKKDYWRETATVFYYDDGFFLFSY